MSLSKKCPVCGKQAVTPISVIAALFDSDSRCSACGSAVRFSSNAYGGFVICVLIGFAVGYFVENFVVGGIIAMILVAASLRAPLKADSTDATAVRGMFKKHVEHKKKEAADKDPVDRE